MKNYRALWAKFFFSYILFISHGRTQTDTDYHFCRLGRNNGVCLRQKERQIQPVYPEANLRIPGIWECKLKCQPFYGLFYRLRNSLIICSHNLLLIQMSRLVEISCINNSVWTKVNIFSWQAWARIPNVPRSCRPNRRASLRATSSYTERGIRTSPYSSDRTSIRLSLPNVISGPALHSTSGLEFN